LNVVYWLHCKHQYSRQNAFLRKYKISCWGKY
jgi:hypothetical protein